MHAAGKWRAFSSISGDLCDHYNIPHLIAMVQCCQACLFTGLCDHAGADEMHDMGTEFKQHWPQGDTQDILSAVDVHATAVSLSTGADVLQALSRPQHCLVLSPADSPH